MSRARRIGADALRWLLAATLFATALGKTLDVAGFVAVLRTYRALPTALEWPIALGVIVAEYALAVALLRRRSPPAALVCALMHLAYAGWALVALLRELPIPNCGCFGVFLARPLGWNTVVEDLVVSAVSVGLWWLGCVAVSSLATHPRHPQLPPT